MSIGDIPSLYAAIRISIMKLSHYYNWLVMKQKLTEKEQTEISTAAGIIQHIQDVLNRCIKEQNWECFEYSARLMKQWNEELAIWLGKRFQDIDEPPPYLHWELHKMPAEFMSMEPTEEEESEEEEEYEENPGDDLLSLRTRALHAKNVLEMHWAWALPWLYDYYDEATYEDLLMDFEDTISSWNRAEFAIQQGKVLSPAEIKTAKKYYQMFIDEAGDMVCNLADYMPAPAEE